MRKFSSRQNVFGARVASPTGPRINPQRSHFRVIISDRSIIQLMEPFSNKKTGLRKITGSIEPRFLETATYSKYSTLFYAFILQISRNQYSACFGGLKYRKVGAWLRCTGLISSTPPPPTFFPEKLPFYNLFGDDDWIKLALLRCFDRLM